MDRSATFKKLDAAVEAKQNPQPIPEATEETLPDKMDYHQIALIRIARGDLLSFAGEIYRYENGIFVPDADRVNVEILDLLTRCNIGGKDSVTTATQQVRHYIMYEPEVFCPKYPFNLVENAIPVKNGVVLIDPATGERMLTEHSPKFRFNYKLMATFDPGADTLPVLRYLDSLGVENRILIQIGAHAIISMWGRVYKRAYFLKGDRDSGKSTFINLVSEHVFGNEICSALSLTDLMYDKFRLHALDGKILNRYSDLSDTTLKNLGLFKNLTGGDRVTIERKRKDPYDFINKAVFLFSANRFPKLEGADDAFWERWIALQFPKHFERIADFEMNTFTDSFVSGFFNLIIDRVCQMAENPKDIYTTDSVERDWLTDSSSAYTFVRDCIERSPDAVIVKGDLYSRYTIFCQEADIEPEVHRKLTEAIKRTGARIDTRPVIGGKQQHAYTGIKYRDFPATFPDKTTSDDGVTTGVNQCTLS